MSNPKMVIVRNTRPEGIKTVKTTDIGLTTFTGDVRVSLTHKDDNLNMAEVHFSPCARTYWHYHEGGQLLRVNVGSGWVCDKGGEPQRIHAGDVIWCPPGTTHWHGADDGTYMQHLACSYGKVEWYDAVDDAQYAAKNKA